MRTRSLLFFLLAAGAGALTFAGLRSHPGARAAREPVPAEAPAPSRTDASASIEEARLVLERHCGACHREDSPQVKRGALAVFNLNRPSWADSMSDDRLRDARGRVRDMQPRGRSDDHALDGLFGGTTTAEEVAVFDAFVRAELERREAARAAETCLRE